MDDFVLSDVMIMDSLELNILFLFITVRWMMDVIVCPTSVNQCNQFIMNEDMHFLSYVESRSIWYL